MNVQNGELLCKVLDTLDSRECDSLQQQHQGWVQWLRPEALKIFVVVTDDGMNCKLGHDAYDSLYGKPSVCVDPSEGPFDDETKTFNDDTGDKGQGQQNATKWDWMLREKARQHFGSTPNSRNYVVYPIINIISGPTGNDAFWRADDLPTSYKCLSGPGGPGLSLEAEGFSYQWLAKETDGLAFSICRSDYNPVFNAIAGSVERRTRVPCEIQLPENLSGGDVVISDDVSVLYESDNEYEYEFDVVEGSASCHSTGNQFYVDKVNRIMKLCPNACDLVKADDQAKLSVKMNCRYVVQ